MQITNYDVLIDGGDDQNFRLVDDDHVGNKRFEVFLNLHRASYEKAKSQGDDDEMEKIVAKIVDIVCHKCVPNGRFLEKIALPIAGESDWMELGEGQLVRQRLHQAFGASDSIPTQSRSSKVFSQTQTEQKKDDFASKRRRRGSYARLRRSISESMLFHSTFSDGNKKKADNNMRSQDSGRMDGLDSFQTIEAQPMDVVFTPSRNGLANNGQPGNARFRVLVSMRADNFCSATEEERQNVLKDLLSAVQQHWNGRFLVSTLVDGFEQLPDEAAKAAVSSLLLQGSASFQDHMVPVSSPPVMSPQGMHAIKPPETTSAAITQPPALTPQVSLTFGTSLSSLPPMDDKEASTYRNAAVESLKAKKAKRDMMRRVASARK